MTGILLFLATRPAEESVHSCSIWLTTPHLLFLFQPWPINAYGVGIRLSRPTAAFPILFRVTPIRTPGIREGFLSPILSFNLTPKALLPTSSTRATLLPQNWTDRKS